MCKTSFFCTGPVVVGFKPLIENIFYFEPGGVSVRNILFFVFELHFVGLKCAKDKKMFF